MLEVALIGGGSWATAIGKILSEKSEIKINWWLRKESDVAFVKTYKHNPRYLTDVQVNLKKVKPEANLLKAIKKADWLVLAVPSAFVIDALKPLKPEHLVGKKIISAVKGIVPENTMAVTDYLHTHLGVPQEDMAIIAGPCHAEEVALERLSYLTIAGAPETAQEFAKLMACRFVKTHYNPDLYGAEYSAIMKNVVAIACGICHGLNYGDNFQAVLVSNAIAEIGRFLDVAYPMERNLLESAYLGDLLVTSYSQFSRNRTFGNMIGRGYSVKAAQIEMNMIAEGYYAVQSIMKIKANHNIELPITEAVYHILYEKQPPATEIEKLRDKLI